MEFIFETWINRTMVWQDTLPSFLHLSRSSTVSSSRLRVSSPSPTPFESPIALLMAKVSGMVAARGPLSLF